MESWQIYLIVALIFVIIEIFTSGFAVICLSFGAIGSAAAAAYGANIQMQILCFSICTILAFVCVRPILFKYFYKNSSSIKTNTDALIGRYATVTETIDSIAGTGRISVDGDNWKAISSDGVPITKGNRVEIIKINSIILTVKQI